MKSTLQLLLEEGPLKEPERIAIPMKWVRKVWPNYGKGSMVSLSAEEYNRLLKDAAAKLYGDLW